MILEIICFQIQIFYLYRFLPWPVKINNLNFILLSQKISITKVNQKITKLLLFPVEATILMTCKNKYYIYN